MSMTNRNFRRNHNETSKESQKCFCWEERINGAFDEMEKRLKMFDLTLENVVQMDCLFRDIWNIPVMEKIIKERFNGKYPVRKSIQTEFAHVGGPDGLLFQVDGVAYCG